MEALDRLPSLLAGFDVSCFDEDALVGLLARVRVTQRCLDGLVMGIGVRADELAAEGAGAPAEEALRAGGAVGSRQARREAARAVVSEEIPGLGAAVLSGSVSGEHVDSIARHMAKLTEKQRAGIDLGDLVDHTARLPVETFDRQLRRRVTDAMADNGLGDHQAKRAASEFRHWFDRETGMGRFAGALDPERYELLANAIDHHMTVLANQAGEPVTMNRQLAAEALVELITANTGGEGGRGRVPAVTVVVDHDTIVHGLHDRSVCQTEAGHYIPPETVARLCCDAVIRRVTLDATGVPINVGRKHRTATDAQWAAIKTMHTSCAWDGCDRPINWCQAHHIRQWDHHGPTDLDNMVPLCSRHHHRVHEGHWTIKLLPDRSLEIHKPDGTHHGTTAAPRRC